MSQPALPTIDLRAGPNEKLAALASLTRVISRVLQGSEVIRAGDAAALAHTALDASQRLNAPVKEPACRKGCGYCCRVYVSATIPEILLLARTIQALNAPRAAAITARVRVAALQTAERDWSRDPFFTFVCPLLEEQACALHSQRPDACRGVSSYSAEACQASMNALSNLQEVAIPRVEEHGVLRGLHAHALWAALRATGLSDTQYALNQALARALDVPDAEARWLAGEDVFAGVPQDTSMSEERRAAVDAMLSTLMTTIADEVVSAPQPASSRAWSTEDAFAFEVTLRSERPEDAEFRVALFRETRPELALLPLPAEMCEQIIDMQLRAQSAAWRVQFPQAQESIVELHDCPAGRIVIDRSPEALHVIDIALSAAARGRGIGTWLLRGLMGEAASRDCAVRLSVADSNVAALRLYRRLGFTMTGREGAHICMEWRPTP